MMILLLVISIIGMILTIKYDDWEEFIILFIIGFCVKFVALVILCICLSMCKIADEKIEIYQKQNAEIEAKIEMVVKQYMEYEHQTFTELKKGDDYITLVSLYPELKSDELVKEEIKVYEENNKKILELKQDKVELKVYRWWIYFGG